MTTIDRPTAAVSEDERWRTRAAATIPGGMYGHQSVATLPDAYPQFFERAEGSRIWDVDGNEYVDLMCSYGPIILGHHHPAVDEAARRQAALADCQNGPSTVMVELAERLVDRVTHADWAMFAKNGTDATTACVTVARAATAKSRVLVATGAYHGAAPWCTPRPNGVIPEDRAQLDFFTFNDLDSVVAAVERADDDLAAIVISPFKHDAGFDQELVDPEFARGLRKICDDTGAALILDDVRCGFRLSTGGSWQPIGVEPDLSAWSKAIANGHSLAAILGNDKFRDGAQSIFITGSFWFAAVSMAAGVATLDALRSENAFDSMSATGTRLREGLAAQAESHGLAIKQTGPVQMPFLTFVGDRTYERANVWSAETVRRGAYIHPRHNWFISAAHTDDDIDRALEATDAGFAAVVAEFGPS